MESEQDRDFRDQVRRRASVLLDIYIQRHDRDKEKLLHIYKHCKGTKAKLIEKSVKFLDAYFTDVLSGQQEARNQLVAADQLGCGPVDLARLDLIIADYMEWQVKLPDLLRKRAAELSTWDEVFGSREDA